MPELGIIAIEQSEIGDHLNGMLAHTFLMGMYTIIYVGTIYAYFTRNSSQRFLVPTTVSIIYLCNLFGFGMQWYNTKWQFINNGDMRDSVFESLYIMPNWLALAAVTPTFIAFILADGLLIWRCFFVWNRSIHVILVPLILLFTESALIFVELVFTGIAGNLIVSQAFATRLNVLLAAVFFITFTTTLITTILIAYRIYSVSKQEGVSAKRFKHVLDIVVQSGAVNSLGLLLVAITGLLPNRILDTQNVAAVTYIEDIVPYVLAMSTTIMVARVALLTTETTFNSTVSAHLSCLQFHARSTHQSDTHTQASLDNAHADDVHEWKK